MHWQRYSNPTADPERQLRKRIRDLNASMDPGHTMELRRLPSGKFSLKRPHQRLAVGTASELLNWVKGYWQRNRDVVGMF